MILLWIPLLLILAAIFFILCKHELSRQIDRRMSVYQNELLSKHYEEVQNIYQKMRGWRHDYHNHIQTMKAYLSLNQLDALHDYLGKLEEDLQTVDTVIKTGNIRLDAILNSKLSLITSESIKISASAQVPSQLTINDFDLSSLIGNLLDNARDSCAKIKTTDDRFIRIYIGVLKAQLYISVTNATVNTKRQAEYRTTKGSGHGFGLRRIDSIVRKYGGYVNRQNEPGVFATEIMLPL
ncbi:MAG: sensor histidine kinase [Sporolactobacillus sp.]